MQYEIMAETDSTNRPIKVYSRPKLFLGKNVHKQVILF